MLEGRERIAYLHDAVEELPERLRVVVEGYFFGEQPMAQIAERLGVSESRVSQLRAEAVSLLKEALNRALRAGAGDPACAAGRLRRAAPGGVLRRGRVAPDVHRPARRADPRDLLGLTVAGPLSA